MAPLGYKLLWPACSANGHIMLTYQVNQRIKKDFAADRDKIFYGLYTPLKNTHFACSELLLHTYEGNLCFQVKEGIE